MLHYQPSLAKPRLRICSSSNDWAQAGRRELEAPEVPRCQLDARTALPGRHPRTSLTVPKMPALTPLTGRQPPRIPPPHPPPPPPGGLRGGGGGGRGGGGGG